MPDKTLYWGDPADAGTRYRTRDDDPAGGGNFVVVEDLDGNLIPLQYNPTSGALETAVPIDTGSNNITTTGTVSTGTLEADATLKGASRQDGDLSFDDWETNNHEAVQEIEMVTRAETDGSSTGRIRLQIDYGGGTSPDKNINLAFAHPSLPSGTIVDEYSSIKIPPGASYRVQNFSDPNENNEFRLENEWLL